MPATLAKTLRVGVFGAAAAALGCADLSVTNPANPDRERVLASPGDVKALIGGSFRTWWFANQATRPNLAMAMMADHWTAVYGNFGMRFNSQEPREAYRNSTGAGDRDVAEQGWENNYAALGDANDGLFAVKNGITLQVGTGPDETEQHTALAKFVQGVSLGNLGLIFDQAFVVDETVTDPETLELKPYAEVSAASLVKLDEAIALASGKTWTLPADYMPLVGGGSLGAERLARIANTMAARVIAYTPRTAAENQAAAWAKVRAYAEKGILEDWVVEGNGNTWWDPFKAYGNLNTWVRVDLKVINMMDPSYPTVLTSYPPYPPPATSADARLSTDFRYNTGDANWDLSRGVYRFSPYSHVRYRDVSYEVPTTGLGPMPLVLKAENDLLLAEALVRTGGSKAQAAQLVNVTRVGRGKLPPLTGAETDEQLLRAIVYEREIELMATGGGLPLYDHRRRDDLQAGTPRHLPVPAVELETLGVPVYTFGGQSPEMRRAGRPGLSLSITPTVAPLATPDR